MSRFCVLGFALLCAVTACSDDGNQLADAARVDSGESARAEAEVEAVPEIEAEEVLSFAGNTRLFRKVQSDVVASLPEGELRLSAQPRGRVSLSLEAGRVAETLRGQRDSALVQIDGSIELRFAAALQGDNDDGNAAELDGRTRSLSLPLPSGALAFTPFADAVSLDVDLIPQPVANAKLRGAGDALLAVELAEGLVHIELGGICVDKAARKRALRAKLDGEARLVLEAHAAVTRGDEEVVIGPFSFELALPVAAAEVYLGIVPSGLVPVDRDGKPLPRC